MSSVLILGATSDVAMSLANEFASHNFNLILAGRKIERLEPLKSDLEIRYSINCMLLTFDAERFDQHIHFVNSLPEIPEITVCVFGYLGDEENGKTNINETLKIIHTNYTGAVSILNIIANHYKSKRQGNIIGISSVAGERGRSSNYLYGSAKAGFSVYLSGLRNESFHYNVKVITVLPGFISSKMTSHLRLPTILTSLPNEVAKEIYKAYLNQYDIIYIKWFWKWIMLIIKNIPEFIFKRLKL